MNRIVVSNDIYVAHFACRGVVRKWEPTTDGISLKNSWKIRPQDNAGLIPSKSWLTGSKQQILFGTWATTLKCILDWWLSHAVCMKRHALKTKKKHVNFNIRKSATAPRLFSGQTGRVAPYCLAWRCNFVAGHHFNFNSQFDWRTAQGRKWVGDYNVQKNHVHGVDNTLVGWQETKS